MSNNTKKAKGNPAPEFSRKPVDIAIDRLHIAPWNPRGEITEESVADLVPSIEAQGLIQRIAVIADPAKDGVTGSYTVIAGNRRLVACRVAKFKSVPCELFEGISEARARQITLIENLKRKDAEPIYVAKVIETLRDKDKLTTEEIAAEIGMPESWVVRRAKLIDLAPEWKEAVESGSVVVTTDLLEKASRYTQDVQKEAYEEIMRGPYDTSARLSWGDVSREFDSRVANLEKATFDRKKCASCPHNSACQPMLWDFAKTPSDEKFGICLDPRCFNLKKSEAESAMVAKLESKGLTIVRVKDFFGVPEDSVSAPDDRYKFACVYHDYNGIMQVRYACKDPTAKENEKHPVNTTDKERAKSLKNAIKKVKEWEDKELLGWISSETNYAEDKSFAAIVFSLAFIYGLNHGNFGYVLKDLARDVWRNGKIFRDGIVNRLASAIIHLGDASASITLATFEAANDVVTPEEGKLIRLGK